MKKHLLNSVLAALIMMMGGAVSAFAAETYDFQELCMKLGKGGPWAVNDGGDAGFTINDATMHFLGDYTEQGFTWNQRFAYEFVDGRGKFTMRNKNNKKDANCGMFSWDYKHYLSVLDLKDGDKVTISVLAGSTTLVSENVDGIDAGTEFGKETTTYTIVTTDETTRLDIQMASATLISKIVIEPYGVETIPEISLSKSTLALIPGATMKLTATVTPSSITTQWSTSDENVATIADDGTVTAVGPGTATIINSWRSEISDALAAAECVVTVADVDLSAYEKRTIDFTAMGDVTLEISTDNVAGAFWNAANSKNNDAYWCANEGLEFLAVQAAAATNGKGWSIVDGEGLYLGTGAGRCAAIAGIQKGQIVEFIYTGDNFYTLSDKSDAGIAKTALNEGIGRAIYLADEDGMIGFELVKGNAVKEINIYSVVHTYAIVGDLTGGWDADAEMTATDVEGIYTLTVEGFEAEAKTYEYKLRADKVWGIYELPMEGNYTWTPEEAGIYNLTFTADVLNHSLILEAVKTLTPLQKFTATFDNAANWAEVWAYAWTTVGEGEEAVTTEFLGKWPGTKLEAVEGVYTVTIEAAEAPAKIIFSNGIEGIDAAQTGDLDFVAGKAYTYEVPSGAEPIAIYPVGGDIAAALAEAKAGVEKVGNITINLAKDGDYTIGSTLEAPYSITINGNDAVIDASALEAPLIAMANVEAPENWTEVNVRIAGIKVTGLKQPLFYSTCKNYLINDFTIDWVNVEAAADVTLFDFTKGSAAKDFNVTNSTFYAPTATTKSFYSSQSGQKVTEANGELIQTFKFHDNTIYNFAKSKNFFSHRQSNQVWLTYDVQQNIFVNCGKSGQTIKGMNGGQGGKNPTWIIKGNAFNFDGADTSADESTGDEEEPVQDSVAGVVEFNDADNGDFNGVFTLAEGATEPESIGAPQWTYTFTAAEPASSYYLVGTMTNWADDGVKEEFKLTLNNEAGEGIVEYMITLSLAATDQFKIVKQEGESLTWYPGGMSNNYGEKGEITDAGEYTVYFRPNGDGGDDWFYNVIYVAPAITDGITAVSTIAKGADIFDMQGRRVQNVKKGLYIVNGKKQAVR